MGNYTRKITGQRLTVEVNQHLNSRMTELCSRWGVSRSDIVRLALLEFVGPQDEADPHAFQGMPGRKTETGKAKEDAR